jgi:hypothetical protein
MTGREIGPGITEKKTHNPGAQLDVSFAIRPFNVIFSDVSKIMYCEGNP